MTLAVAAAAVIGLGWSSLRSMSLERQERELQFRALLTERLGHGKDVIAAELLRIESELDTLLVHASEAEALRTAVRGVGLARQGFVLKRGALVYPARQGATHAEAEFLLHTRSLFAGENALYVSPQEEGRSAVRERGWVRWFWDDGLEVLFWRRADAVTVIGVQAERAALKARLAALTIDVPGLVRLRDQLGHVVAVWGKEPSNAEALVDVALPSPLEDWRLELAPLLGERDAFVSSGHGTQLSALAALALVIMLAAFVAYREQIRAIKDAETRVSFVTQVSHELKTPLTNIRLYGEMLAERAEDDKSARYAQVITGEAQRLGRLIDNVLGFSKAPQIRKRTFNLDALAVRLVDEFRPSFLDREIVPEVSTGAGSVDSDPDAVAQILANLLSNVEKYAASGKWVGVTTRRIDGAVELAVSDRGPGVAEKDRARIFEPYVRLSDHVTEGVSGTGLGLSIAGDLARSLGGSLRCEGNTFVLRLPS